MKTRTIYTCEVCGTDWDTEAKARQCESFVAPPCPVKVGDDILVYARYDGPKVDQVKAVRLGASSYRFQGQIMHAWFVDTHHLHRFGKDSESTDTDIEAHYVHLANGTCADTAHHHCVICWLGKPKNP